MSPAGGPRAPGCAPGASPSRELSGAGAAGLARPLAQRRPLLLVTDFDGTISRIVIDPWAARIVPHARRALRQLAGTAGVCVAVLSGRTAADVACRVRVGGATYLGNHGLERGWLPRGVRAERLVASGDPALVPYEASAVQLAVDVAALVAEPWLVVERKGPAVAFHFRAASDVGAAGDRVSAAIQRLDVAGRFAAHRGRRVLELRPPGAPAKGDAVRRLVEELRPAAVIALGDDRSDAEAFVVLRAARDSGALDALALAVRAHRDMPPDAAEAADGVLASPDQAATFLSALARQVRATPAAR